MPAIINISKLLLEDLNLQIQNLKNKYVGEGKPIKEEDFAKIQDVTNNKFNLLAWLTKKVGTGIIKAEDVYKYKEYFEIFDKNKNKFEHKDLNLYKTAEDVRKFLDTVISVREKDVEFEDIKGQENYVKPSEIEKLVSSGGAEYLGMWKDYQVFRIFKSNEKVWRLYRDILGRCKGRARGAKIDICTIGDFDYFQRYLKQHRLSNYFLLYNLNDPKSPYQLHHETRQFMDKNDVPVEDKKNFNHLDFYKFISEKFPKYELKKLIKYTEEGDELELPVEGKGWKDENGKQGQWETYDEGYKIYLGNYKDNKLHGPFEKYNSDGTIETKGTWLRGKEVGDYEDYTPLGVIRAKGRYNTKGERIGVWRFNLGEAGTQDYVMMRMRHEIITGYTKDDKVRYIGKTKRTLYPEKYGPFLFYDSDGNVIAKGRLIKDNPSGLWKYFDKNGNVIAEGSWAYNEKNGPWLETIVIKGRKYKFKLSYMRGTVLNEPKIEVYDAKGNFLISGKRKKIEKMLDINLGALAEHHYINTMD